MYPPVFFGEKMIQLLSPGETITHTDNQDTPPYCLDVATHKDWATELLKMVTDSRINQIMVTGLDWTAFKSAFTFIQAAGGLVENEEGKWLIMFRRDKWDLPKGKIDAGETPEICAIREVEEETGLRGVQLLQTLTITYHIYPEKGQYLLKETFWFKMKVSGKQALQPQTEEDIEKLLWMLPEEWNNYSEQSYASINELFRVVQHS